MKDKNFSIDQLEDMLSPRQEFRVSRDFAARVMEAAKAGMDAPVRRPARPRWAWAAAAAAVAAVIVVGLFLPMPNVTPADAPVQAVAEVTPSGADVENQAPSSSDSDVAMVSDSDSGAELLAPSFSGIAQAAVIQPNADAEDDDAAAPAVTPVSVAKESTTLYAMNCIRVSNNVMVDDLGGEIIMEADLPITNLDNYELTPEEEQLALRYQHEEFLESMRSDLEIARMIVDNCIKDNK